MAEAEVKEETDSPNNRDDRTVIFFLVCTHCDLGEVCLFETYTDKDNKVFLGEQLVRLNCRKQDNDETEQDWLATAVKPVVQTYVDEHSATVLYVWDEVA